MLVQLFESILMNLHEDPETLNPVIEKIRNVIETYRKVDQR